MTSVDTITGPGIASSARDGTVSFFINGQKQEVCVGAAFGPGPAILADHIRGLGLTGSKAPCREGGCGACAVIVTVPDVTDPSRSTTHAVNSCLVPVPLADGWHITTVEGVASEGDGRGPQGGGRGYHEVQKRLAAANASQCGYCTPGVVMAMCGLLQNNPRPSESEIEAAFDGNLCRCTGYRPILQSMKTFAADSQSPDKALVDIEDLNARLCPKSGQPCAGQAGGGACAGARPLNLQVGGAKWLRPISVADLDRVMREHKEAKVRLVVGNTASGIYKDEGPFDVYVDISCIKSLSEVTTEPGGVRLGACVTLTEAISALEVAGSSPGLAHLPAVATHLAKVGNVFVRNAGSIGGNLMLKHYRPEFPSDVFTVLEAAGATVTLHDTHSGTESVLPLRDLVTSVDMQMRGWLLKAVYLPSLHERDHFRSFRVTPRSQNAHAYVNAAFRIRLSDDKTGVVGEPSLVFGGIDDKMIHAINTEKFLSGKPLTTEVIQGAVNVLKSELSPAVGPLLSSPDYRRDLAACFLYKTLLGVSLTSDPRLTSGGLDLERPVSRAEQTFQEVKADWPLKQPMAKVTALLQTSGEAQFVNDMPSFRHELCAAFVTSGVASATVASVDPKPALALPGVTQYITSEQIPGKNVVMPWCADGTWRPDDVDDEELLSTGKIMFAGQPIGIILAETQELADEAAKRVSVTYSDVTKPVLTIKQGIEQKSFNPCERGPVVLGDAEAAMRSAEHVLEGEVTMGTQYHYYLENQVSVCVPDEDLMQVHSSTQNMDQVQTSVANLLGRPQNYVQVRVPRLGGGFGGKAITSLYPAGGAALAAHVTGRPVRMNMSLSANIALAGKRFAVLAKYKVGYSSDGTLQSVIVDIYGDGGCTRTNNQMLHEIIIRMDHGYHCPNWRVSLTNVRTNTPTTAACRSPGPVPALHITDTILEHVAHTLSIHPVELKERNLYQKNQVDPLGHVLTLCNMREVWAQLKAKAEVEARIKAIEQFNQANRWRKRGITMTAVKHGMAWGGSGFPVHVAVYAWDGTVVVSQSGVECGQGLFTKVAQAAARTLRIPMDMVKVRPVTSDVANNSMSTGGSTVSEQCVYGVQEACKIILQRMEPVRKANPDADWLTLCRKALDAKVDLGARFNVASPPKPEAAGEPFHYFVYCAGVFETELDVLTGQYLISRVDLLYDCGESLNPLLDVGQLEGGMAMGLGHHLTEDIVHDPDTGRVLSDGTWDYKMPAAKDIPVDWRVHFLPDAPNPNGIHSSKAVGEPGVALGCGPVHALRLCMMAATAEQGKSQFLHVASPLTPERIKQSCGVDVHSMVL